MAKRSYDEIENINDVDGPMSSTSIHGAVVTSSPVKKGRKAMFFDGLLADESSQIRLVGFQGMQQRKLNDFHQRNVAVALENCQVKPARQGEGYEVMLKTSTIIKESPKKLDVASLMADIATASKTVTLESLDVFQKVTVNIKVVELKRVFSGISPALSLTLWTLSLSFLCITTSSHSTALLRFTDSFSTLRRPFLFNANLWPQPQAALFTCTTVSHFGHVFLRYIELTHSICNYHKQ